LLISQLYVPFRPGLTCPIYLALDRIVWNKTETDENTSCPMIDWTSQNWTKRDWRNYQQEH
jgi:hypothetical protein